MNVSKKIAAVCLAAASLLVAPCASAQWRRPFPAGYPAYFPESEARIQVTPKSTEVYVDGYYAGQADDFDGVWQRLRLPSGEHEIQLYLEGHRTHAQKFLFRPGETIRLKHTMEPLAAGEVAERPKPSEENRAADAAAVQRRADPRRPMDPRGVPRRGDASTFGAIAIRVQPADAVVLIDGERWESPPGGERLIVQVPDGPHRVEIRKEGMRTYTATIEVRRGETVPLNVSLSREE